MHDPANVITDHQNFTCEGFPRPLTQADIDALYKRALDAEDHLRAEVSRCQSIIDRQAEMERVSSHHRNAAWDARKEVDAVTERLRMSRKSSADNLKEHCKVSQSAITERDDTIADLRAKHIAEKYLADECAALIHDRDATISNLRRIIDGLHDVVKARDQTIEQGEATVAELERIITAHEKTIAARDHTTDLAIKAAQQAAAIIKARDQTIADLRVLANRLVDD